MSLIAPRNTLRHQLSRSVCTKRNMGWVSAPDTGRAVKELVKGFSTDSIQPEEAAQTFYLLQHAMSDIRQRFGKDEPLGDVTEIVELYHKECAVLAQRVFTYLLLICTREARHVYNDSEFRSDLREEFGKEFQAFISDMHEEGHHYAQNQFKNNAPPIPLETYCAGISHVFYRGEFDGGYGGEAWGKITDVLHGFVVGTLTAEMMLDTAFTLAHNGGPIFNKGMGFCVFDTDRLMKILDVQASGQIPQLLDSAHTYGNAKALVYEKPLEFYERIKKALGDEFGGTIDWFLVAKDAEEGQYRYNTLMATQENKFGKPEWKVLADANALAAKGAAEKAALAKQAKIDAAKAAHEAKKKMNAKEYNDKYFHIAGGPAAAKETRDE